jgi:methionyl-tRNA formyltransferase
VARYAESRGLPVLKPTSLKKLDVAQRIRALRPDAVVVAAFGKILPKEVLDIPPLQCINVHPSLLPKYRGASPMAFAILEGETETGVTIMIMEEQMDTGPILAQVKEPVRPEDTEESLAKRLSEMGARLLLETLPRWAKNEIRPQAQDHSKATYSRIITKADGQIDWNLSAEEIWLHCRAFYPWPACYTQWNGKLLKLLQVLPIPAWQGAAPPGQVVDLPEPLELGQGNQGNLAVATGKGALILQRVQEEGRNPMDVKDFLRGHRDFAQAVLGR